MIIYPHIRL